MKAFLMYAGRDFDIGADLPDSAPRSSRTSGWRPCSTPCPAVTSSCSRWPGAACSPACRTPQAIAYRQHVLADCLEHAAVVRQMYDVAVEAVLGSKRIYRGIFARSPDATLRWSIEALQLFTGLLRRLRQIADYPCRGLPLRGLPRPVRHAGPRTGRRLLPGRRRPPEPAAVPRRRAAQRRARPGRQGNPLHAPPGRAAPGRAGCSRISGTGRSGYTMRISDRDESGHQALADLRGRGINLAANALAQSTDHILSFFTMLRCELGFYIGCLNVRDRLAQKGEPVCFPVPLPPGGPVALSFRGLYDVCLSLRLEDGRAVGNDASADGKTLVIITGANQGGKSTFLRSVGLAQLMMQCGMFVAAESFAGTVAHGPVHALPAGGGRALESGKLDEELEPDEPDRRPRRAGQHRAVQRVVRGDQRAGGLADRAPDRLRAGRVGRPGLPGHALLRPGATACTRSGRPRRCSCGRSGEPTGGARSGSSRASRSPRATARTCTSASSARSPIPLIRPSHDRG